MLLIGCCYTTQPSPELSIIRQDLCKTAQSSSQRQCDIRGQICKVNNFKCVIIYKIVITLQKDLTCPPPLPKHTNEDRY
jgi:hypothetical protein